MSKSMVKEIFSSFRIWFLIFILIISFASINYKFSTSGVAINKVINSDLPIESLGDVPPTQKEVITSANGMEIEDLDQFYEIIKTLNGERLTLQTNKGNILEYDGFNLSENKSLEEILGLSISEVANSNLQFGIDLKGGVRAILEPERELNASEKEIMLSSLSQRLNAFGLSNVIVRPLDNDYILVEMAGMSESEFKDIILREGNFEGVIANQTVFSGGEDVASVCKSTSCAGIDPYKGCSQASDGTHFCNFRFSVYLTPDAATRFYETIQDIPSTLQGAQSYLTEDLYLYLDGNLQDSLKVGSSLKEAPQTNIQISGSGSGSTRDAAIVDALDNMKKLQIIMETGSLPVKLNIESLDVVTPDLGDSFLRNSGMVALIAIAVVSVLIFFFYRSSLVSSYIVITMFSEIIIILGLAAAMSWDLDLAAIAGIIVSVGTGVDDQIVLSDETLKNKNKKKKSLKKMIEHAFFIIFGSYFTTMVAMFPLLGGIQVLRGFALTTMIGITVGVFITRPAFGKLVSIAAKYKKA